MRKQNVGSIRSQDPRHRSPADDSGASGGETDDNEAYDLTSAAGNDTGHCASDGALAGSGAEAQTRSGAETGNSCASDDDGDAGIRTGFPL